MDVKSEKDEKKDGEIGLGKKAVLVNVFQLRHFEKGRTIPHEKCYFSRIDISL
jgi:hypothetical protein